MKILFIDVWTKGIKNFERLVPELKKRGNVGYKLLHFESWHAKGVPPIQEIKGISCCDVASYHTLNIYKILKKEKPDVVLVLSLSYIFDRTIISMCQHLNIKVYYLAHGRFALKEGVGNLSESLSLVDKIVLRLKSFKIKVLLNYIYFNTLIRFRPDLVAKTLYRFVNHSNETEITLYNEELKVNKGMVYFDSEKEMYEKKRHFPHGMIVAVGNPEMDSIINSPLEERELFLESINLPKSQQYGLYLDDGFVQSGIMSIDEWKAFLNEVNMVFKDHNLKLVVKLHPRTDGNYFSEYFKNEGIIALKDVDFKNLIYHSKCVIGHDSTTIVYSFYLKKPVILSRWGVMSKLKINYPKDIVNYCFSVQEFEKLMDFGVPVYDTNKYLIEKCGLKEGKSIEMIVNILMN